MSCINIQPQSYQQSQAEVQRSQLNANYQANRAGHSTFSSYRQKQTAVRDPTQQRHPVSYQRVNAANQNQTAARTSRLSSSYDVQSIQPGCSTFNFNRANQSCFPQILNNPFQNQPAVHDPTNQFAYYQQTNATNTVDSTLHGDQRNRVYYQQPPNSCNQSQAAVRKPTQQPRNFSVGDSFSTFNYSKQKNEANSPVFNLQPAEMRHQNIRGQYCGSSVCNPYRSSYGYRLSQRNVQKGYCCQQACRARKNQLQNGLLVLF